MLIGESNTVFEMRRFLQQADLSETVLVGGESGTGRMGMVRRICQKAGVKPCDYLGKVAVFDAANRPDEAFYETVKQHQFIITDSRAVFDKIAKLITHSLWIAPLRDRVEDIPLLVEYFSEKVGDHQWSIPPLIDKLLSYWWPLNVFELKRIITSESGVEYLPWEHKNAFLAGLSVKELISLKMQKYWESLELGNAPGEFFHLFLDSVEREFIESALHHCDNSRQKTAQLLDIHRNTLTKKMKRLGMS